MSEKVVLPKFDLPGQGPHPAVRVLQVAAGLLVLGLALWRHHSLQVAADARAQALIAARAAEAAAVIEAAKARAAEAAAKIATARAATALAAKGPTATDNKGVDPAATPVAAVHRRAHHHGATKPGKALAKTEDKKPARPGSKRDDAAIDKLLASFK